MAELTFLVRLFLIFIYVQSGSSGWLNEDLIAEENKMVSQTLEGVQSLFDDPVNHLQWLQDTLTWCRQTESRMVFVDQTSLHLIQNAIDLVFFVDQQKAIVIDGQLTFDEPLHVFNLQIGDQLLSKAFPNKPILESKSLQIFKDAEKHLNLLNRQEEALQSLLNDALKLEGNQVINGIVYGSEMHFSCGCTNCFVNQLNVKRLNGRNMDNLFHQLVPLQKNIILSPKFNFNFANIEVRSNLQVSTINGINPQEIVTKNGNYNFTSELVLPAALHVDDLHVRRAINGWHINGETVLTRYGDQFLDGQVTFAKSLTVRNLNANCHYKQLNRTFNNFLNSIIQNDATKIDPITISAPKYVNNLHVYGRLQLDTGPSFDGINMNNLKDNMITRTTDQVISAHNFTVDSLIAENVKFDTYNGQTFDVKNFVARFGPRTSYVRARKTFVAPVDAKDVVVSSFLNNMPVLNGSLDLLLKKGNQLITGHKNFQSLSLRGAAYVNGNIGGFFMNHLPRKPIYGGNMIKINGPISANRIEVKSLINGVNITEMYANYVQLNQPNIYVDLKMDKVLFKSPLICHHVNGLKFDDYFLSKKTSQTISKALFFEGKLIVNSYLDVNIFNNYSLTSYLHDSLRTYGNQTFIANQRIDGNLLATKLYINRINGRNFKDLVLLNNNSTFIGHTEFKDIVVAKPFIKDMKSEYLNQDPTEDLFANALVLAKMLNNNQVTV